MKREARTLGLLAALAICAGLDVGAAPTPAPQRTQVEPALPQPERRVLAAAKLEDVSKAPLYFSVLSVTVFAEQKITATGADTVIYQMAGTTEVLLGGAPKILNVGDVILIKAGQKAELKAGAGPSAFVTFNLVAAADLDRPLLSAPSIVRELYRTPAAIPGLKPGRYDLNLTAVTFPPRMPLNAPHHRSGAALYYVVSGIGMNAAGGKATERPPGEIIFEPAGFVHQWGNQRPAPMTFLAYNINREGEPAIIQGEPAKAR